MEVIVTIVVILIAVAISTPRVASALDSSRLGVSASRIAAVMNSARSESISSERVCEVDCSVERGTCTASCFSGGVFPNRMEKEKQVVGNYILPYGKLVLTGNISDKRSSAAISFYPDGTSSGGSIAVTNDAGEKKIIEVFRATALPYVYDATGK